MQARVGDYVGAGTLETGTRLRTRRAILDAAVETFSRNAHASLGEIASAAGVGRTTMRRYFAERSDLVAAIVADAVSKIQDATVRARLDEGPAPEALSRLIQEFFEFGDVLLLVFNRPDMFDTGHWDDVDAEQALISLVQRGHAEGTVDPALEPAFIQQLVWSVLFAAWECNRLDQMPKHHALAQCLYTIAKTITP